MKSLFLLAALCLPLGQLEQKGTNLQRYDPVITSVQTTMSYESQFLTITGRNFDMVTGVKVDGQAVQIVRKAGNQIVIRPNNTDPGFGILELLRPGNSVKGTIEFAPSLRAAAFGGAVNLLVNPLEPGQIWLNWSMRTALIEIPGVYYPLMLDMTAPWSGQFAQANSLYGEAVSITAPAPPCFYFGLLGLRQGYHVQALCMLGEDRFLCHTNMVSLAPSTAREATLD